MKLQYVGPKGQPFHVATGVHHIVVRPDEELEVADGLGERLLAQFPTWFRQVSSRRRKRTEAAVETAPVAEAVTEAEALDEEA